MSFCSLRTGSTPIVCCIPEATLKNSVNGIKKSNLKMVTGSFFVIVLCPGVGEVVMVGIRNETNTLQKAIPPALLHQITLSAIGGRSDRVRAWLCNETVIL